MKTEIPYLKIAPIPTQAIQIVAEIGHSGSTPDNLNVVLYLAMNGEKVNSQQLSFPVYFNTNQFHTPQHYQALNQFSALHEPFVAVQLANFHVYISANNNVYGTADSFTTLEKEKAHKILEEEILL